MADVNEVKPKQRSQKPKAVEPVQQVANQDTSNGENTPKDVDIDVKDNAAKMDDTNSNGEAAKAETSSSQAEIQQVEQKKEAGESSDANASELNQDPNKDATQGTQPKENEPTPSTESDPKPNNENIVVEKADSPELTEPKGLVIEVKNSGVKSVYEPLTKTSINAGQTVQIACANLMVKQGVLNNIKQFKDLGKNLEVLSND